MIHLLVEGQLDAEIGRKILREYGAEPGKPFGLRGNSYIAKNVQSFSQSSSQFNRFLAIADLMESDENCAPSLTGSWLPRKHQNLLLRIAVNEIESWLLADREGIAAFLGISQHHVPANPDLLADPKQSLVNLARRCRQKFRREAIVPPQGISSSEGPGYTSELMLYVNQHWQLQRAEPNSPSLAKALNRIRSWV